MMFCRHIYNKLFVVAVFIKIIILLLFINIIINPKKFPKAGLKVI